MTLDTFVVLSIALAVLVFVLAWCWVLTRELDRIEREVKKHVGLFSSPDQDCAEKKVVNELRWRVHRLERRSIPVHSDKSH